MTQMERSLSQGKDIDSWYIYIVNKMKSRKYITTDKGELWFLNGDGAFHICPYESPLYGFIIEYAEGVTVDKIGMAESGDMWSLLDYDSPEEMFQAMLKEIVG